MKPINPRINVYLLTGFLGAGKTTVLNQFLTTKKKENNSIIENEFGKVSIDSLLVAVNYDALFELNNGCICCSLDNELVDVLAAIIKTEPRPDNLFIEASGVADPGGLAALFNQKEVAGFFDLQKITCIVDASTVEDWIKEVPEVSRQLAVADIIVLNKKTSVTADHLVRLKAIMQQYNSLAEIIATDHGQIPFAALDGKRTDWTSGKSTAEDTSPSGHPLKSIYIEIHEPFDREKLLNQLTMLLFLSYHQIYRIKGLIWLENNQAPVVIQTHGKQVNFTPLQGDKTPEYPQSQLVVIGKGLQRNALEKLFRRALARSENLTP